MSAKTRIGVVMFSAMVAFYAIVGGFLWDRSATAKGNQWAQLRIFDEVLYHISKDYVDEPDMERVRVGALRGLAEGLDPYSAYLTPAQTAKFKPVDAGLIEASGMVLSKVSGFVYVVSVLEGSPADKAGIATGDFIEYVGKAPSRDMSLYDAEMLLATGQPVEIKLFRSGQSHTIPFTPGPVSHPSVESKMIEGEIGYVHVPSFPEGRTQQVKTAVEQLTAKGAKKIVLDLRGASFGTFEEGAAVADLFLDNGVLGRKLGRGGAETATATAKPNDTVFQGPLSVVIDTSTAGAGEVVASALLANKRGEVVGEKSFGAGAELDLFKLRDGGALLLTTVRYAPPVGKAFMEEPVTPSTVVESPERAELVVPEEDVEPAPEPEAGAEAATPIPAPKPQPPSEDVQLKKAVELLRATNAAAAAKAA